MIKIRSLMLRGRNSHLRNATAKSRSVARQSYRAEARVVSNDNDMFSSDRVTFANMTSLEMMRSMAVLWICSIPGFSDNASKILNAGKICLGRPLFTRLMRYTAYGQFVAGDEIKEIQTTAECLAQNNVAQMLAVPIEAPDYSNESTTTDPFQDNLRKSLDCVEISRSTKLEGKDCLMQIKLTALVDFDALESFSQVIANAEMCNSDRLQEWITTGCHTRDLASIAPSLTGNEAKKLADGVGRILEVVEHAEKRGVCVLVDAEHTWINPAIQELGVTLMRIYNRRTHVVYMTYQAYLKETRELIKSHAHLCRRNNAHFALKLVRGAYVVAETKKHGTHPPYMCEDWEATNRNYDECLEDLLSMDSKYNEIVIATHNETSVRLAVKHLRARPPGFRSNVSFAQLYGMANYMSFTLGNSGYQVYKSVPYGTVEETLPYLGRRVKENCLVLNGIRKEMTMLRKGLVKKIVGP